MDFERWKRLPPVSYIAGALAFDEQLSLCSDWDDYTRRFIAANSGHGRLTDAARKLSRKLSTGEVTVLAAMLHAADCSHIADEISGKHVWKRLEPSRGDYATAAKLAIMRS